MDVFLWISLSKFYTDFAIVKIHCVEFAISSTGSMLESQFCDQFATLMAYSVDLHFTYLYHDVIVNILL